MPLKLLESAEKSSSVDYSEGSTSTPARFSSCYWPIQYHKDLVPPDIKPEDLCLLIIPVQIMVTPSVIQSMIQGECKGDKEKLDTEKYSLISQTLS